VSLLTVAQTAAAAAGRVLLDARDGVLEVHTKSSDSDPVSSADTAAQRAIVAVIEQARPGDGLTGEEDGLRRPGTSGVRWVVDPLDGTVNYLYGRDEWAVSIAACDADGALAAIVYAPAFGRSYTATRGSGAWLATHHPPGPGGVGRRRLGVRTAADLATSIIGTGFSYAADRRRGQASTLAGLLPRIADIRRSGSAALDLAAVAAGTLDAFYEDDLAEWDWAAGALIAAEAGAVVESLPGPAGRSGILAAAPALHTSLRAAISGR
jgi:myo-inositol-1(or 4)-monophosphatase